MKLSLVASLVAALAVSTIGCSGAEQAADTAQGPDEFGEELRKKGDAKIEEAIRAAAKDALYISESDREFTVVTASLDGARSISEEIVRTKFASFVEGIEGADKPLSKLNAMSATFAEWKKGFTDCEGDCDGVLELNAALEKNLRGIKVYYFGERGTPGQVDGTAVSIFIVGRTPQGKIIGVHTIAIWT